MLPLNPLLNQAIVSEQQLEILSGLFRDYFNIPAIECIALKGDASSRCLYRLWSGNISAIGVYGPNPAENAAFIGFTKSFLSLRLPVPKLYLEANDGFSYLLEDLGDETLFSKLTRYRPNLNNGFTGSEIVNDYESAVSALIQFQIVAANAIDRTLCYQGDVFDDAAWQRDHNYFLNRFVELLSPGFPEREAIGIELTNHRILLEAYPRERFLYRDFQSRNIMVTPDGLRFLDYQSGRVGAVSYDIASLLYDARADLPQEFRNRLFELHIQLLKEYRFSEYELREAFAPYALLRILQALGSYGNNGIGNGRKEYLTAIPFGLRNALSVIGNDDRLRKHFKALAGLLRRLTDERKWEELSTGV